MAPRLGFLLATLGAVLILAACGGGGDDETTTADFRKEYAPISAAVRGLGEDVGQAVTTAKDKTDAALQLEFAELSEKTTAVAAELAAEEIPDDAKIEAARGALVAGLRKGAADLEAISVAAGDHDAEAARAATVRLVTDSAKIKAPRERLDKLVLAAQ